MRRRGEISRDRELAAAQARIRELERLASSLAAGLDQVEADLERIAASRAWRIGHGLTTAGRRLSRRRMLTEGAVSRALERIDQIRRANPGLPSSRRVAPLAPAPLAPVFDEAAVARADGPRRRQLALELRTQLGIVPARDRWPAVSVIVLSRDGHERLARLLGGLVADTDYPDLELIVVDNGSAQPLAPIVAWSGLQPAQVLRNETGESFSVANNQAAARAGGEVLLFVNDDIELFEPGWCRELVSAVLADGVGAAAATLLHTAHDPSRTESGWIVQHRGIRFRIEQELPRAFNDGDGADPFDSELGRELPCPAVSAACLAVRRDAFEQVGGFAAGYRFGTEDVDLGLTLLEAGWEVRCCTRSVAFHRESSTQSSVARVEVSENRRINRQLFHERWGPRLMRELRRARWAADRFWTYDPLHIGITVTSLDPEDHWGDLHTAREFGAALEELGARVSYVARKGGSMPAELDVLVTLMDTFDLTAVDPSVTVLAWVRNWTHRWTTRPWFWRVDAFLASSGGSAAVLEELEGMPSVRFPLATAPHRFNADRQEILYDCVLTANRWGVPREIERALAPREDERFAIFGQGWEDAPAVAEYLRGPVSYDRLPWLYAHTRVVLDDTAGPTLPYGALNARVFDALASGALVITNCEAGARELFDEDFPVWSDGADLRSALDGLLADDARRTELADRYRRDVLGRHTYTHRAREVLDLIGEQLARTSFVIRIGAPDWERAERWGDLHFARALERELRRHGHRCLVQVLSEWDDLAGDCYDVSIVLRGRSRHRPKPGQLNVLWVISHPEELSLTECEDYDLVAVASPLHAEVLREQLDTPVVVLEQATDPRRFRPDPDPELARELVFVGNSRQVRRPVLEWLLPTERDLAIWGGDWQGLIDMRYVAGDFIANETLPRVYSSAKLVLADHWPDMREHGYISNRIFDALACGAMVLSDPVAGLQERFGDAVAIYHGPDDLAAQIELLLGDDRQRHDRAERGRALVLGEFTFARRVDALLARVSELAGPGVIAAPGRPRTRDRGSSEPVL